MGVQFPAAEAFRCADLGTIMQRSGEAASMAHQKLIIERMSDDYLRMPVEEIGLLPSAHCPGWSRSATSPL